MRTVLLVLLGRVLAGCGTGPVAATDESPDPTLSSTWLPPAPRARAELPAPSTPPAGPAERAAATMAYARFWTTVYELDDQPLDRWPALLGAVTTQPLLPKLLDGMLTQRRSGIREYGSVVTRPVSVDVHGAVATLVDCQDASRAGEAYVDSGLPTTVGQARTPFAAALRRGADGRWRVSEARQLDTIC